MVIAPDPDTARRYLAHRSSTAGEVHLVTAPDDMAALASMRLRRSDRVEWLHGWHRGAHGRALAIMAERCAQVGRFGAARHVFRADG